MYGIYRKSLYSPQYLLFIAVVGRGSGPVVTAADVGDGLLVVGADGNFGPAHTVVAGASEVGHDVVLDGQFFIVGHLAEEMQHAKGDAHGLVAAIVDAALVGVFRMVGINHSEQSLAGGFQLSHLPAQAVTVEGTL